MRDWESLTRHAGRVAFSFSGGKDSTVLAWMLRHAGLLEHVTAYHLDTGDLFPEMAEHVASIRPWFPHWVTVRTDARGWAKTHGEPSDLVPYSSHGVGQMVGEGGGVSARYDCCLSNLMRPIYDRIKADGRTLLIRGTRRSDMPNLPAASGDIMDGLELFYPIQEWTDEAVFAFVKRNAIPLPPLYGTFKQGPECATCPAWWKEGRGPYLKARYPALFEIYQDRVSAVMREIVPALRDLMPMLDQMASNKSSGEGSLN